MTRNPPTPSTPAAFWQAALAELRLQMSKATFDAWLANTEVVPAASTSDWLLVILRNNYAKEWLDDRLRPVIERTVAMLAGRPVGIGFVVGGESAGRPPTEGGKDPVPTYPTRVRIYSHITRTTFLHVEDALNIGKLRLFAGTYERGRGIVSHAHHFVDLADARVLLAALAQAEPEFRYREYKGTAHAAGAISRVFSAAIRGEQVFVELKNGPGRLTATGAVEPSAAPTVAIHIDLSAHEARRMAMTVLAYVQSHDLRRAIQARPPTRPPAAARRQ